MVHTLDITKRGQIERIIAGALKCAIDTHGPITLENRHSAAKRVYCALKGIGKMQRVMDGEDRDLTNERGYSRI